MANYWDIWAGQSPPWMTEAELTGEDRLIVAIFKRVVSDLHGADATWRREAVAFFAGYRGSLAFLGRDHWRRG